MGLGFSFVEWIYHLTDTPSFSRLVLDSEQIIWFNLLSGVLANDFDRPLNFQRLIFKLDYRMVGKTLYEKQIRRMTSDSRKQSVIAYASYVCLLPQKQDTNL